MTTVQPYTLLPGWAAATSDTPMFRSTTGEYTGVLGCNFLRQFQWLGPAPGVARLVYANFAGEDQPGPNPLTVTSRIQKPSGSSPWTPVTFGGQSSAVIRPGGMVVSDPVSAAVGQHGDSGPCYLTVRTWVGIASTSDQIICNYYSGNSCDRVDTAQTDVTATSAFSTVSTHWGYGPVAVLSNSLPASLVTFIGDSIAYGFDDSPDNWGWTSRWAARDSVPCVNVAMPSETASDYADPAYSWLRRPLTDGASVAICEHGVNDGYGAPASISSLQVSMRSIWADLMQRGVRRIYQTTITPATTSTDGWATAASQTPAADRWSVANLAALNTWIRSVPPPLTGYIEVGNIISTAQDSGIWRAGYTGDGLHPNTAGHEAVLAALPDLSAL